MGGVPGQKFTLMRAGSLVINLAAIIVTLVLLGVGIEEAGHTATLITGPIVLTVLMVFLLKAEFDILDDHRAKFLGLVVIIAIVINVIIGLVADLGIVVWTFYVPSIIGLTGLIFTWQYTLTIYKNEKQRYYIGFIVYIVLFVVLGMVSLVVTLAWITAVISLIAVGLDEYAERQLLKAKLMVFIA